MEKGSSFHLYKDIAERTDGDVYIGVVGPVRTGKSTFIARFMEELVLPHMAPGPKRDRLLDELPQSGSGKTIMTTQPKFVPSEAAQVFLQEGAAVRVRMVDSVGYLVKGALGSMEGGDARMVHTPWSDQDIPFEQAAEIGTRKVITDHATIGMVVTHRRHHCRPAALSLCGGGRSGHSELKAMGKPFVIVLNSATPRTAEALQLRENLENRHGVPVMLLNVKEMGLEDIQHVLESILLDSPCGRCASRCPPGLHALESRPLAGKPRDGARPCRRGGEPQNAGRRRVPGGLCRLGICAWPAPGRPASR